jgi:uncharacterized protein YabE (DUF348 family)
MLRRVRVAICIVAFTLASAGAFALSARKTIALTVNGETRDVVTYAMSAQRLLEQEGITSRSHDVVTTSSPGLLQNHSVVTVRTAYQATITIDGKQVPFWTVATSADQLLGFFKENDANAAKVTVNVTNVYNKLTGGLIINRSGPVTVIADGKTSIAPNGKLPAASILDSKGIVLHKEDRVSVEEDNGTTILRVQRVTHGQETRTVAVAYATQTIVDSSLKPGETVVRQTGRNGSEQKTYNVTYVDGVAESRELDSTATTSLPVNEVIAVGPSKTDTSGSSGSGSSSSGKSSSGSTSSPTPSSGATSQSNSPSQTSTPSPTSQPTHSNSGSSGSGSGSGSSGSGSTGSGSGSTGSGSSGSGSSGSGSSGSGSSGSGSGSTGSHTGLWHPTPSQAQVYAAAAAAQYGWTGQNWTDLVKLWNRESSWEWYAENASSGAYGIPQSFPANKMATFGANWRDDGGVQIDWGLSNIKSTYGSPSQAWAHSEQYGWY